MLSAGGAPSGGYQQQQYAPQQQQQQQQHYHQPHHQSPYGASAPGQPVYAQPAQHQQPLQPLQQQQQQQRASHTYVDQVRAMCAVLNIGAAGGLVSDVAQEAAARSFRARKLFRENRFADGVEQYLPPA